MTDEEYEEYRSRNKLISRHDAQQEPHQSAPIQYVTDDHGTTKAGKENQQGTGMEAATVGISRVDRAPCVDDGITLHALPHFILLSPSEGEHTPTLHPVAYHVAPT